MEQILPVSIIVGITSVIIGLFSLLITLRQWFVQKERQRKEMTYEVISDTPIPTEEVKGKVQTLPDSQPINNAHRIVLRISNSGNVPILPKDFAGPIEVNFGEEVKVLEAKVVEVKPENVLEAAPNFLHTDSPDSGSVKVGPLLLDSKDSITLEVLLNQFSDRSNMEARARIAGLQKISQK